MIKTYCIKSMPHAFNSHVLSGTNPYINKAIHKLLMRAIPEKNTKGGGGGGGGGGDMGR